MLGVVILNYKNYELTINAVNNVIKNIQEVKKIVIVDNDSKNNSFEILKKTFEKNLKIDVILSNQNGGYAKGNNIGIKKMEDEEIKFIIIMNPDVELYDSNIVKDCIKILEKNQKIAAVSPMMVLNNKINYKSVAWKIPKNFDDILTSNIVLNKLYNPLKYNDFEIKINGELCYSEVDVIPGSFFVIKYDVFRKIGFFDENTFLYCEERILGKRLKDLGMTQSIILNRFFLHNHNHKVKNYKFIKYHLTKLLEAKIYYNLKYNGRIGKFIAIILKVIHPLNLFLSSIIILKNKK